ncbi:nucleotidyltransferase family protein [Niallia oryzisoli]|uniref:Nucleotidyltransferase family protein n=1 Tax=Niallia oryzisoli TaxID=1737571 RepID=A0ABZ2CBP1_9BACI
MANGYSLNLDKVPRELKLQLEIMNCKTVDDLKGMEKEWFADIDWDKFLELAMHHRVYSVVYQKIKQMDPILIPEDVRNKLQQKYKINTFQMLALSGEMEQVSRLFLENGIRTIFLKGPVIAYDLYGDISLRTSSDLDFLIPLHDLDLAEDLLIKLGYVKDDYFSKVLNDWKWRHHHITFFHPQRKVKLEVHWRLNPGPSQEPAFHDLWERKRVSSLTSSPVYFLGKEDLFLYLVTHGARHGWSRLRWLVDIHQIVQQELDWSKLYQLLMKYQYPHVGGQALILASQLLKTPIVAETNQLLSVNQSERLAQAAIFYLEEMVNLHTDPVPENVAMYHKRHLFSLMSKRQRFFFIMSFLYPYPEDTEVLPLPKNLQFLYFPLRPFLWAWRKSIKRALS